MAKQQRKSSAVSVGNWMWTLFLAAIPGVNILVYIISAIGTKKASKRAWAIANILWVIIVAGGIYALIYFFGEKILAWCLQLINTPVTEIPSLFLGGAATATPIPTAPIPFEPTITPTLPPM